MSDYGVFEASSTDGHEEEQRQRQARRDLGTAIEAAREGFGDFLGSSTDKQDYQDRLALVMNDLMQKVADSGVMPVPGVMRKVKAALRPEFRKQAAPGFDPNISDENLLAGLQIAEALNHDGSNQAKVDELRAEVDARGLTPLKTSRLKQADDHLDAPGVDMSQLRLDGLGNYGDAVAVVFDDSGNAVDLALNWETAQSMAQEGYDVQVVRGDGGRSQDEIQRMVDHEKELRRDLFGSHKTADQWDDDINRSIDEYLDATSTPRIAPHPEYGEGVWSDEGVKRRVLSLDPNLPVPELVDAIMREMGDLYDSIDRELAFWYFSQVTGKDYDDFYNAWMNLPSGKYFSRRKQAETFQPGDKVMKSGYPGTVQNEYMDGMYEVKMERGTVVVPAEELTRVSSRKTALKWKDTDFNSWVKMDRGAWSIEVEEVGGDFWLYFNGGPADGQMEQLNASSMEEAKREAERIVSSKGISASRKQADHNGWSNFETWQVAVILDNDETAQEELAQGISDVTHLRDIGEFYAQGNGIDFGQVNWQEIYDANSEFTASLKQAGSAQVLQKLENALNDQRSVDVICSNSPDGSFSNEREIPVDEGLQKVRGWVSAGDLVDTAQGGNFFDFEHRASGENVNFYITQEY